MTDKMRRSPHCDQHKPKESAMNTLLKPLAIAALLIATQMATSAQAKVWIVGSPEWNTRLNCVRSYNHVQMRAGDPRWQRMWVMKRAGVPASYAVTQTNDGRSIVRSADRYCAARGQ